MWYPKISTYLCSSIKKHKNKLIFGGVFIGGMAVSFKFAQYKINKLIEFQQEDSICERRHLLNLDQVRLHCSSLTEAMLDQIKTKVVEVTNTEKITEHLKSGTADKLMLWNELKIAVFQRVLTSIYSLVIITVALRVQLFQIAGMLHKNLSNTDNDFDPKQQHFLSTCCQFLLECGIERLSDTIKESVINVTNNFPLQYKVTCSDLESTILSISSTVLYQPSNDIVFNLHNFVFRKDDNFPDEDITILMDVLDSPDCHKVVVEAIEKSISLVGEELFSLMENDKVFPKIQEIDSICTDIEANKIPLAKSLPILNQQIDRIFSQQFFDNLSQLPILDQFSVNVYKSFLLE